MDCGWTDRRLACWTGDEGWWLWHSRGHHSRHPRRRLGWLGLWAFGNLARRRHDRFHRCGICWRGDFGLDYPLTEKSLIVEASASAHNRFSECVMAIFHELGAFESPEPSSLHRRTIGFYAGPLMR